MDSDINVWRRPARIALLAALVLVGGCGPKLLRYYDTATWVTCPDKLVKVSAFTMDSPMEDPKTLLAQLSPQGQEAFILEIGKKTDKDISQFFQTLTDPHILKGKEVIEKARFNKRVVFSVTKDPTVIFSPADRISDLKITLTMLKEGEKVSQFESWNRFETQEEVIDLGKMTRTQQVSGELAMTIGPATGAAVPVSAAPKVSASEQLYEELVFKKRRVKLSGAIEAEKTKAFLYQEGAPGIDLTGTFLIDLQIHIPHSDIALQRLVNFGSFYQGKVPNDPAKVEVKFSYLRKPSVQEPVKCALDFEYVVRRAVRGERIISEGYHEVEFQKGYGRDEITLVSRRDLQTLVFCIARKEKTKKSDRLIYLAGGPEEGEGTMFMTSYDDARGFLRWLRETKSKTIGKDKYDITLHKQPLQPEDYPHLYIQLKRIPELSKKGS